MYGSGRMVGRGVNRIHFQRVRTAVDNIMPSSRRDNDCAICIDFSYKFYALFAISHKIVNERLLKRAFLSIRCVRICTIAGSTIPAGFLFNYKLFKNVFYNLTFL